MLTNRQIFLSFLAQTSESPMMLEIASAKGVFMYGPAGEKYIDLISGVSVSNTGHCHPHVVDAVKLQAETYFHLMVYGEMIQNPQVKYAEQLAGLLPESLRSCYFVNSGSEAVEGALKLAKRFTGRSRIISFRNSYHGSTHGALSIQGSERFRNAFRPLLPDTFQIGLDEKELGAIDDKTACVVIETVQGEAGVIDPGKHFLAVLRDKCTKHGALLVFDEIQTGFGRTGNMFAFERAGVVPDILLLAKSLGGGMPLGAFISSRAIMTSLIKDPVLGHITTFGGHPICCAAGLAALEVIKKENLIENCNLRCKQVKKLMQHQLIKEIRGEGLLLAVQLTHPEYVSYCVKHAPEYGIILDYFLFCEDAFRISPPLIINEDEMSRGCEMILRLLDDALVKVKPE